MIAAKQWFKRFFVRLAVASALVVIFGLHVSGVVHFSFVSQIEHYLYDIRLRMSLTETNSPSDAVVIVDIDEKTFGEIGFFPWPRDVMAKFVDQAFDNYGVRVVGFDVLYQQPYDRSALKLLDQLPSGLGNLTQSQLDYLADKQLEWDMDITLANSYRNREVVLGYMLKDYVPDDGVSESGTLPAPVLSSDAINEIKLDWIYAAGYVAPYEQHMRANGLAGYFSNPSVDRDGIFRRLPLLMNYEGDIYGSLAFEVARRALGNPPVRFVFDSTEQSQPSGLHFEGLRLGDAFIPADERLNALIPYRGAAGSYQYLSFVDVLKGRVEIERLFDKVILVGTTAPGMFDLRPTPVGSRYPGIEIHANLIDGILNGHLKHSPQFMLGLELATLVVVAMLISILTTLPAFLGLAGLVLVVGGTFGAGTYAWEHYGFDVPVASTMMLGLALFLIQYSYAYAVESRKKRHLSSVFGQYIPAKLVSDLSRSEQAISLTSESREMSVLFTDVRGFTSISESLPPEELSTLMNEFLTPITQVIHRNKGTIDKYMGDAVMAFWGAPIREKRHAFCSVSAGLELVDVLNKLQPTFQSKGWPHMDVGIGVNTGVMRVGNMGSEFRMAYTVLGDAVNLGSRLEGLTKYYHVRFIVSESTAESAHQFLYRPLDIVRVKGRDEPVRIYEPIVLAVCATEQQETIVSIWKEFFEAYQAQEWSRASGLLDQLSAKQDQQQLLDVYKKRIQNFLVNPPGARWDGAYNHDSK